MQQGNINQVVSTGSTGSTGTAGVSKTSRIGSVMVNQAYNWSDIKFALSKCGYGYAEDTTVTFNMLITILGNKDITLMLMSYSHPLYNYDPIIITAADKYFSDSCQLYKENVLYYMNQWILIHRILSYEELEEKGYEANAEIYTSSWQDRNEFCDRVYAAWSSELTNWSRQGLWDLWLSLKRKSGNLRTFGIWLKDYEVQVDDKTIFFIDDADEDQIPVDWLTIGYGFLFPDPNCDLEHTNFKPSPSNLQELYDLELMNRFYR